jgi:chromate transporter
MSDREKLIDLAKLFLKLGTISFGGPAAHIAMMEDEVVRKRKWMSENHFLDLIGATSLIPGPNSTEMTMHCGYERAGWKGLIVAGISFLLPAILITGSFAWLYVEYGELPYVKPFIYGIQPAVIAIIIMAAYKLGKKAIKTAELAFLGIITVSACLLGLNEVIALFACGIIGLSIYAFKKSRNTLNSFLPISLFSGLSMKIGGIKILLIFLKIGAILYGSGYVLFAFLDAELVSTNLLSRQELMDAVAFGQFTPGPVLSTATFIGWQLNGLNGALLATLGIFLPSFLFVGLLNPLIPKMQKSKIFRAFLDAINVAAVSVIIVVCIQMAKETVGDWRMILIACLSIITVFVFNKLNSAFIVLFGAIAGYALSFL